MIFQAISPCDCRTNPSVEWKTDSKCRVHCNERVE